MSASNTFVSNRSRGDNIKSALNEHYDLIIIGGGITGAGILLDAVSRGMKVLLVEKTDFAFGTSSRSTKLIHGGLRYLKQLEFALVAQVGRERAVVHNLAPHLVIPQKLLMPLIEGGSYGKWSTSMGLSVYDAIADVKKEDRRQMLEAEEAAEKEPLLDPNKLKGAGYYAEYRTDDARLTIEVLKKAIDLGAHAVNYMKVFDFIKDEDFRYGVKCIDELDNKEYSFYADHIVNATGPWVDGLRKIDGVLSNKKLHLTKGVHIVFPYDKLPIKQSIYFDVEDGRMIFAIPRGKITYVGTTDTNYVSDLDSVLAKTEDVQYIVNAVNHTFPDIELEISDVISSWAGLRPLIHEEGKSPSELSRKDEVFETEHGLISIAGGKLTGYRKMAEKIVDLVVKRSDEDKAFTECRTNTIKLCRKPFTDFQHVQDYIAKQKHRFELRHLDETEIERLVYTYGKKTKLILKEARNKEKEITSEALILSELKYTLENELVLTASDFFIRRTGFLYFDIDKVRKYKNLVCDEMKTFYSWSDEERSMNINAIDSELEHVLAFRNE